MSHRSIILPKSLQLDSHSLSIQAIEKDDKKFYIDTYTDLTLMQYINAEIDLIKIHENFYALIDELNKLKPDYMSYVIKQDSNQMGIFGIKLLSSDELEFGMILRQEFQQLGWSKKIKKAFINYAFESLEFKHIIAYCKHDNGAANHVNQVLGFALEKQFIHKSKNHLMNKWVLS